MDICKSINEAIKDESDAILFYTKMIGDMPPEHREHIKIIEGILEQEAEHFFKLKKIAVDMKCPEIKTIDGTQKAIGNTEKHVPVDYTGK